MTDNMLNLAVLSLNSPKCLLQVPFPFAIQAAIAIASPISRTPSTVQLNGATFTGASSESGQVSKFLWIPFAQPP